MSRLLSVIPLVVVAATAAALTALPAAAGGAAHAALAEPGMIVVADSGNNRVQVFHSNGTFAFDFKPVNVNNVASFSSSIAGVAVGPDGRIHVADSGNDFVHVFYPNGTFAFPVGSRGDSLGEFRDVDSVAVGPDGRIHVLEDYYGINRVQVFRSDGTFMLAFGSRGDGERQFDDPSGIAVGPDGRIHVSDTGNSRVQVFHPNGTFAFQIGSGGVGDVILRIPAYTAVGPDGRIHVVTRSDGGGGSKHIAAFHPNGTFAFAFGPGGADDMFYGVDGVTAGADGGFKHVSGVAVGADGRVVVIETTDDSANHTVQVFRPDGTFAFKFGSRGVVQDGGVRAPEGVAVGADGRIYVADYSPVRVSAFHPNGTLARTIGSYGAGDGEFYHPVGVAVGADGRIVVVDWSQSRIHVFYPNGTARAFGSGGAGEEQFRRPGDVAVGADGRIYVADSGNGRVQVIRPDGTFVLAFETTSSTARMDRPTSIAVGPDGLVYVSAGGATGGGAAGVAVFHSNGTFANWLAPDIDDLPFNPQDIAVGSDGRIYAVSPIHNRAGVILPNGTLEFAFGSGGAGEGQFDYPNGVAVGSDGRIYVSDSGNGRVQVFHPNGTFAFAVGEDWVRPGAFRDPRGVAVGPGLPPSLLPALPANGTATPPDQPAPPANGTATPPTPVVCRSVDLMECDLRLDNGTGPPAPVTVVIESRPPAGPLNLTGAGHAANLTIDVAVLAPPAGPPLDGSAASVVTFPSAETSVVASFATVTFPPSVEATHVPAGGRLALRVVEDVPDDAQVQGALAYEGSGRVTLQRVVEVGAESGRVVFDMPVRILLEGQAGGRAFYIEGGADGGMITPIDLACAADDTGKVHRHLDGADECQMDSTGGDKIIYTYHLTRFGTAQPERAIPPPEIHTCSVGIGMQNMAASVRPGEYSAPVRQVVVNSGSLRFAGVELAATPWIMNQSAAGPPAAYPPPAPPAPVFGTDTGRTASVNTATLVASLPASATEVSTEAAGGAYRPLAAGMSVAGGLEGGAELPLWFRLNLSPHDGLRAGTLVQTVTYQAVCGAP